MIKNAFLLNGDFPSTDSFPVKYSCLTGGRKDHSDAMKTALATAGRDMSQIKVGTLTSCAGMTQTEIKFFKLGLAITQSVCLLVKIEIGETQIGACLLAAVKICKTEIGVACK